VVDIRPFLGPNAPVATVAAVNHDDTLLRNLDNNHPQYHTDARALTWHNGLSGEHVTDGDLHDHTGGAGAQIGHTNLADIGTTTHANLDLFVGSKAAASGLASLNGSSKVVQDPANATATPTASKIVMADAGGLVDGWVSSGSAAVTPSLRAIGTGALEACAGNDSRLGNDRNPTAHASSHATGGDVIPTAVAGVSPGLLSAADKTKLDNLATPVTSVSGTAPIVSSGGTTPAISITAASGAAAGSMSAAHYTKLDGITSDAIAATASLRSLGATATTACAGNDSRLSDPRTPSSTLAHKASHISGADQLDDATAAVHGLMTAAQFTKLAGIAAGATVNVFGNDYQTAISLTRDTYNTNTNLQTKVTLTTPALTGTYRVSWTAVLDDSATNQSVQAQLYNTTNAAIVGVAQVMRATNAAERRIVSGFAEVVFAGVAKAFAIQYGTLNTGATVGIQDARIEIWRVA
jgi:methionine-rich copper-binding protein CopC